MYVRVKVFNYNRIVAWLRCAAVPIAAHFSLLPPPPALMYIGVCGVQATGEPSRATSSRPLDMAKLMDLNSDSGSRGGVWGGACGARRERVSLDTLQISLQRAEGHMLEHVVTLIARTDGMWMVQWPIRGQGTAERSFKVQY